MEPPGPALGLDFGTRRIGLAVSDAEGTFAFPAGAIERRSAAKDLAAITTYLGERFGKPKQQSLFSTYFDTDGCDLRKHGLSFRVRKNDEGFVQTVKQECGPASGVMDRLELEAAVPTAFPLLDRIDDDKIRKVLDGREGELKPVFRVEVERQSYQDGANGGNMVIDVDVGEVKAGRRHAEIRELEIESLGASTREIFELARELASEAGLRVSTVSKSERGYQLRAGMGPGSLKAPGLSLDRNITSEDALIAIIENGLAQLLGNDRCVVETDDPEGIHQMRVAARRLRSAFRVFKATLPPAQYDLHSAALKELGAALGPARDLDVFHLELVEPVRAAFPEHEGLAELSKLALKRRKAARKAAAKAVLSPSFTDLVLNLRLWIEERAWRDQPLSPESVKLFAPARGFASDAIRRRFGKVKKEVKALKAGSPEAQHMLRIEIKKLRYCLDFFGSLFALAEVKGFAKRLARVQDELGHINDVNVARTLLAEVLGTIGENPRRELAEAGGIIIGWNASRVPGLTRSASKDVAAILKGVPAWARPSK